MNLAGVWAYWRGVMKEARSIVLSLFGYRRWAQIFIALLVIVVWIVIFRFEGRGSQAVFDSWDTFVISGKSFVIVAGMIFLWALIIVPARLARRQERIAEELRAHIERLEQRGGWIKHAGVRWRKRNDRVEPDGPFCSEDTNMLRHLSFTGSRGTGPASDNDAVGGPLAGALFCPECDKTFRVGPPETDGLILINKITVRQLRREAGRTCKP